VDDASYTLLNAVYEMDFQGFSYQRVLRLIRKWLKAGVLEDEEWRTSEAGTPQGVTISPLLANIYLYYVLDVWARWWISRNAIGDMIVVQYAGHYIF